MITNSKIAWGDQLGAQLMTLAALFYVAEETNQKVVFWNEMKNVRRGYQFLNVFDIQDVEVVNRCSTLTTKMIDSYCTRYQKLGSWQQKMQRIYKDKVSLFIDRVISRLISLRYNDFKRLKGQQNGLHTAPILLEIDLANNYDIFGGFGTYQDWKKYEDKIRKRLSFKKEIQNEAHAIYHEVNGANETVAIHFRRTDYLVLSSLNLGLDYYKEAMSHFDSNKVRYLVFSDDIEGCKDIDLFYGKDVVFMPANSAGVDMCLMSLCDNIIIANSTFSFWGAFLGPKERKKENRDLSPRFCVWRSLVSERKLLS